MLKNISLSDGRNLSYAEYGAALGEPVLVFHGTPGSGKELANFIAPLSNIRLIAVERPGYGYSDSQTNRTLLDWPDDIVELADSLLLNQFSVLGYSGGGAYAAACAYKIPERLSRVALVSSSAPFDVLGILDTMAPGNRALFELAAADYQQLEQQMGVLAATPEAMLNLMANAAHPVDKVYFSDEDFLQRYRANLAQAMRQGLTGLAYDMSLIAQPWGFSPSAIDAEVHLWHGEQDANVPIAMGQYLAGNIPSVKLRIFPEDGHMLMFSRLNEILQTLVESG